MDIPCIGVSKYCSKEEYIDAAESAVEDYLKHKNINIATSIIIIIKIYRDISLIKVNEIFDLVQDKLNCQELSCSIKELEDESIKDKIEITLVGI